MDHHFVEWKEHFVSKGEREPRCSLLPQGFCWCGPCGESILAVVGTERSARHIFYVVSEDFVRFYGSENSIHSGFKWRSRREVVDWLTSMLSKQNTQGNWSKTPKCDSEESNGSPELSSNGFAAQATEEPPPSSGLTFGRLCGQELPGCVVNSSNITHHSLG